MGWGMREPMRNSMIKIVIKVTVIVLQKTTSVLAIFLLIFALLTFDT